MNEEKIKSIIEGMLFASAKPVTLKQMTTRLRLAIQMDQENEQLETKLNTDADVSEEILETHSEVFSEEESQDTDNQNAEEAEENDDILSQLTSKQEELELDISTAEVKEVLAKLQEAYEANDRGIEIVQVSRGYQMRTKFAVSVYLKENRKTPLGRLSPSALETLAIVAYEQPVTRNQIEDIRGVDTGGVLRTLLDKEFIRIVGRSEDAGRPLIYGSTSRFLEVFGLDRLKDLPSPSELGVEEFAAQFSQVAIENGEDESYLPDEGLEFSEDDFSEEDAKVLSELDESLDHLSDVESQVEASQKTEDSVDPVAESSPAEASSEDASDESVSDVSESEDLTQSTQQKVS